MSEQDGKKRVVARRKFLSFVGRNMFTRGFAVVGCNDHKYKVEFLPSDWPYVLEDNFRNFHVTITSHMVVSDLDKSFIKHESPKQIRDWFNSLKSKQLGAHLFITRFGRFQMVYTLIDPKTEDFMSTEAQDINSVYPTIRNEETAGEQKLLLGIFFGRCDKKKYRSEGKRLYHRNDYSWLQIDNCWEMTEKIFDEKFVLQWHHFKGPHFALFVCSGAKLLVEDNCLEKNKTTRSLIQMGGVIVVEGELSIRVKELNYAHNFKDCFSNGLLVPSDKKDVRGAKDFVDPVLFLGATDSQYDSICWGLTINQIKEGYNKKPSFALTIPGGGQFDAIEKWEPGIQEIWARHAYHRLHESTVTQAPGGPPYCTTEFIVPSYDLLGNIFLGSDEKRAVKCEHKVKLPYKIIKYMEEQPDPPISYRFRKIKKASGQILMESKDIYGVSIPPAFPPIEYKINNTWHYLYLPNNKEKMFMESLDQIYHLHTFEKKPEWCLLYDNSHYRLKKDRTIILDEFETRKHEQQLPDKGFSERIALCDGTNTRLGADGWIYKVSGKSVSTYETKYYYKYK